MIRVPVIPKLPSWARESADLSQEERQEWLRESLLENELEPLAFVSSAEIADDPAEVGIEMRRALGLDKD